MTDVERQEEYNRLLSGHSGRTAIRVLMASLTLLCLVLVWQVALVIPHRVGKVEKSACQSHNVRGCRIAIDGIIKSITPEQKQELLTQFGGAAQPGATGAAGADGKDAP